MVEQLKPLKLMPGQVLESMCAPVESDTKMSGIPFLCVVIGRYVRIEVSPIEQVVVGERFPIFSLDTKIVEDFSPVSKWPNGPEIALTSLRRPAGFIGKRITTVETSDPLGEGGISGIQLNFENACSLAIEHSEQSPMSLDLVIVLASV